MNKAALKLAEKIHQCLKRNGHIERNISKAFIALDRREAKEVIDALIYIVDDANSKRKLMFIRTRDHFRYDPRLSLLMIWLALDGSVDEGFDPEYFI